MSYTQFVELITHMNMGDGVPVTLKRVNGEVMEECPYHNPLDIHKEEFKEHLENVYEDSKKLLSEVEENLRPRKPLIKRSRKKYFHFFVV